MTSVSTKSSQKLLRNSNLELFRIITMFLIVAHHYVVNSGLNIPGGPLPSNPTSLKSLFLFIFGAWGKTGINCFVLITGYFMCKSQITFKKFLKLVFEVVFYRVIIYLIFSISGYSSFSIFQFVKTLIPVTDVGTSFTNAFIVFYLFIPFLTILVNNLKEIQHIFLIVLCLFTYVFLGSFSPLFEIIFNYTSWYMVLFLIASYVRLYPKNLFQNAKFWGLLSFICIIVGILSIFISIKVGNMLNMYLPYYFLGEANRFLTVLTGFSAFMFFKNINVKPNKFINVIGASTFGVLLIHSNSSTMRTWLWYDILDVVKSYNTNFIYIHSFLSVIAIFTICIFIDYLRICFIEKPLLKLFDKSFPKTKTMYKNIETKILNQLNINS